MFSFLFLLILLLLKRPSQPKIRHQKTHTDQNNSGSNFSNFPQLFFSHNESTTSSKSQPNDSERIYFQRHATLKNKARRSLIINRCLYRNADFSVCKGTTFFCNSKKTKEKIAFSRTFSTFQR